MIYLLLVLSFFLGYYLREVLDTMKKMVTKLEVIRGAEEAKQPPTMGYSEPMTRAEVVGLLEEEKIRLLNP